MASKDGQVPKRPDAIEFMKLLAEAVGGSIDDVDGLAPKLGVEKRYVYRWRNGSTGISLSHVMTMMRKSGMLDALRRERQGAADPRRRGSDPEVVGAIEDLVALAARQAQTVELLIRLLGAQGRAGSGDQ